MYCTIYIFSANSLKFPQLNPFEIICIYKITLSLGIADPLFSPLENAVHFKCIQDREKKKDKKMSLKHIGQSSCQKWSREAIQGN